MKVTKEIPYILIGFAGAWAIIYYLNKIKTTPPSPKTYTAFGVRG